MNIYRKNDNKQQKHARPYPILNCIVMNGNIDLLQEILTMEDLNVFNVDLLGNNVLHQIILAKLQIRIKVNMLQMLFQDQRKMCQVLHQPNTMGITPFVLATQYQIKNGLDIKISFEYYNYHCTRFYEGAAVGRVISQATYPQTTATQNDNVESEMIDV